MLFFLWPAHPIAKAFAMVGSGGIAKCRHSCDVPKDKVERKFYKKLWSKKWTHGAIALIMTGRTRFAVCRLFLHLAGSDVAPLLGVLNRAARQLLTPTATLRFWEKDSSKSREPSAIRWILAICRQRGDVFWDEGEAGDYFNELFTDSAQRYLSEPDLSVPNSGFDQPCRYPVTRNVVVMITVAFEGSTRVGN